MYGVTNVANSSDKDEETGNGKLNHGDVIIDVSKQGTKVVHPDKSLEKNKQDADKNIGDVAQHKMIKGKTVATTKEVAGTEKRGLKTYLNIGKGVVVRLCLCVGNLVAIWRTTTDTGYTWPWGLLVVCVAVMGAENLLVTKRRNGREWMWWSPCILIYLATTLPAIWMLQLHQREVYLQQTDAVIQRGWQINSQSQRLSDQNSTQKHQSTLSTTTESSVLKLSDLTIDEVLDINTDTWVIIVGESLIYLIVFARWFLPRGDMTREFLADLLLEFLAIASDIMELLAIFDIHEIRANLHVTLWILTIWSLSFTQFVPVLMHKRKYLHVKSPSVRCIFSVFGDYFVEVVVTCMSIFLQDGQFLVLRLYIMIKLDRITYSLVFFVFKNIVSLFLLFYRLTILFSRLPACCCARRKTVRRTRTVEYKTIATTSINE